MGDATITILDVIGQDWTTGEGVTTAKVAAQLRAIGERPIEVQINSPGGDMFEGIAIYNLLREHPASITVKVLGLAASAASIVAMAGDKIAIGDGAWLMIHNSWVMAVGDRNTLAEAAALLEPFDAGMAAVYASRARLPVERIRQMMDAETWIGAREAVQMGLADEVLTGAGPLVPQAGGAVAHALRRAELALCRSMPRSRAREILREIRGTPGAAPSAGTPGAAAEPAPDVEALRALATLFRG
ncbi:MAG: head maturation protease, ClpP-related [Sphingomonadaceae bacterium]